ncbi:hypothetical protein D9M68_729600 [compost metagenome]
MSTSWMFSRAPWNNCGNRRESLAETIGLRKCRAPTLRVLLETLTLPVRPGFEYSSCEPPEPSAGNRPLPAVPAPESSFRPSMPMASIPTPTVPSV